MPKAFIGYPMIKWGVAHLLIANVKVGISCLFLKGEQFTRGSTNTQSASTNHVGGFEVLRNGLSSSVQKVPLQLGSLFSWCTKLRCFLHENSSLVLHWYNIVISENKISENKRQSGNGTTEFRVVNVMWSYLEVVHLKENLTSWG